MSALNNETLPAMDESDAKKKEGRKRKRHVFNAIREQMEFYFGDANLSKDRYMKQLIEKDPFIPLEIFLSFNKIKSLAESEEMLAKALTKSEILELDETNKKVRRKTAMREVTDADDRTIYVEALPSNVDHDWMKNMFARFGKVTYVSLPKYSQSRKPKDFGFVEFQKEKYVTKAVTAFKAFNGVLSMTETEPAKLASIRAHNLNTEPEETKDKKDTLKRPLDESQDNVVAKKQKLEDVPQSTEDDHSSSSENKTENEIKEGSGEVKKKRRKHKNSADKQKKQLELATEASFYELKILPKRDWKRLRNKYLNLQREKASELKRKAAKERQQQQTRENTTGLNSATETHVTANKSKNEERIKMKMNFYGAGVDSEPPLKQAKHVKGNSEHKPFMKFEQGLIVEIKFDKPCVDIKDFKRQMRQHKAVKYVDIKEGAMEAFLRLESADEAANFVQNKNAAEGKFAVLCGEPENAYWEKIERDRQMKLNKEIKVPSKRGRQKVKAALAKHILFDDEEAE